MKIWMSRTCRVAGLLLTVIAFPPDAVSQREEGQEVRLSENQSDSGDAKEKRTPEEKMNARHPQPVRVGDLIGLPVLDAADRTLGYVDEVLRTQDQKIILIVPYGGWFGWAKNIGWLAPKRSVAVHIETVVILARQINAVDMDRPAFETSPTWKRGDESRLGPDEIIKIGLGRR